MVTQFTFPSDHPLYRQHDEIEGFLLEISRPGNSPWGADRLEFTAWGKAWLKQNVQEWAQLVSALLERLGFQEALLAEFKSVNGPNAAHHPDWKVLVRVHNGLHTAANQLVRKLPRTDESQLVCLFEWLARQEGLPLDWYPVNSALKLAERYSASNALSNRLVESLKKLHARLEASQVDRSDAGVVRKIDAILSSGPRFTVLPGEPWVDRSLADLNAMPTDLRAAWASLLERAQASAELGQVSKWIRTAENFVQSVGVGQFRERLLVWFSLVPKSHPTQILQGTQTAALRSLRMIPPHADLLTGLVWACGLREDKDLGRALMTLATSAYRKVASVGPHAVKVGNACVTALGMMPGMEGVYQLALLKVKVKFGTAQKGIEKALTKASEREGLPRADLEEMAVPAYGLTGVGICEERMGDFTARLTVTGPDSTELVWLKPDGKTQRGVPAVVRASHAEDLKELQAAAKDIQRMLPAQRERIDSLFLQQKTWPFAVWRERYLDHPLVGVLARRLLWEFTNGGKTVTGIWFNGQLVDLDLRSIKNLGGGTTVQLWHPIGKDVDEIVAWRAWLDAQRIQQPFKQAHREIYLLTDTERHTRLYSNRYAAHVLKQHQFNALCGLRGWKNKLRLLVDAEFPPATLLLPKWGLRAEFWIEGAGTNYGVDTNETGTFLYLTTDQVRFYESGGTEPLQLEEIPRLVFSEVMRDVDLFVGVASVGNDPAWSDGGPEGRHRDYWQSYSFGELSASAKTRKEVLQHLVPKLKIAAQCSFEDKFLVVRGTLRTYKIHLGSGNILMSPNDQYLCIVARPLGVPGEGKVILPFEGDRTLSLILSKAFMLAADEKITDPTILSQIRKR